MTTAVGGTTKKFSPFGVVDVASNPASLAVDQPGVPTHANVASGLCRLSVPGGRREERERDADCQRTSGLRGVRLVERSTAAPRRR